MAPVEVIAVGAVVVNAGSIVPSSLGFVQAVNNNNELNRHVKAVILIAVGFVIMKRLCANITEKVKLKGSLIKKGAK